jgi:hypothetical protein
MFSLCRGLSARVVYLGFHVFPLGGFMFSLFIHYVLMHICYLHHARRLPLDHRRHHLTQRFPTREGDRGHGRDSGKEPTAMPMHSRVICYLI